MKATGIIFSNIYDAAMGELTKKRTVASLPFGGRYRLIDFVLSNMSNSNITAVGIITKYNYQSLMDHLGSCSEWDLDRKNGGVYILPPYSTGSTSVYRGNLEALANSVSFLNNTKADYVVMCDTTVICSIDFEKVVDFHIASGADVTVIANHEAKNFVCDSGDLVMDVRDDVVTDLAIGQMTSENALVGMGMFVIERTFLLDIIKSYVARGRFFFERDFLQKSFLESSIKISVFAFNKTVLRNHSIAAYFANNFKMFDEGIRREIFRSGAPVYTKIRDEAPAFFSASSEVNDCVVADGCVISGKADRTVMFRDVEIEQGAVVRNSIIMQGSKICRGAKVDYAIVDKNVTITPDTTIAGAMAAPVIINKGMTI